MASRWHHMLYKQEKDRLLIKGPDYQNVRAAGSGAAAPLQVAVFATNWSAFTNGCQYLRDPLGIVRFRGGVKKNAVAAPAENIMTLPVGYRPQLSTGSGTNPGFLLGCQNATTALVTVDNAGVVRLQACGVVADAGGHIYFDALSFRAEDI